MNGLDEFAKLSAVFGVLSEASAPRRSPAYVAPIVTEADRLRWGAQREAKIAAKAAKALAIRDAQLLRGQKTA